MSKKGANAEVYADDHGGFSWRIQGANGKIVTAGGPYPRRLDAHRGLREAWVAFDRAMNPDPSPDGDAA